MRFSIIPLFLLIFSISVKGQQTGYAASNGVKIYYSIYGEGKPLLVINGGPGMNSEGFSSLAELLAEKYQVILFDQRGTGKSKLNEINESTVTMDLMLEDIEALRKHLGFQKWSVLGHSFGGMVSSYYATKYEERIQSMILSSSGGINMGFLNYFNITEKLTPEENSALTYWTNQINNGDTTYNALFQRGMALAPAYLYKKEFVPKVAERLTQGNATVRGLMWSNMINMPFDCTEGLRNFNKPVLIIQGKQDVVSLETAQKPHTILPVSKIVIIDKCAHYGWLEQPEEYLGAVFSFLDLH